MDSERLWKKYKKRNDLKRYFRFRFSAIYNKIESQKNIEKEQKLDGKRLLSVNETNNLIFQAIESGTPFFVGRFGQTEMNAVYHILNYRFSGVDKRESAMQQLYNNAGFFPNDIKMAERYADLMISCCSKVDLQAIWDLYMEDYMMSIYASQARLTKLMNLSPWVKYRYGEIQSLPWSAALKGKKVLVVHPFVDTIQRQYQINREKIFQKIYEDANQILPQFELHTLKAVQTIAGNKDERFETWFEALSWMEEECRKINFDVAVIGCGAYGYPLAAKIKEMGKVAIHLGGITQILFGILGKRWEEKEGFLEKVANESWTRASEEERPQNLEKVEEGCYW